MRIIVRREHSFGDVIDTTAIVARLKRENPRAEICVETHHTRVYSGNSNVALCANRMPRRNGDRFINLDGAYERSLRKSHPIDCYSEVAFGDRNTPHEVFVARDGFSFSDWSRIVVLHAARSWANRTLPREWWQSLIDLLVKRGLQVALTGTSQDHDGLQNAVDLRNRSLNHQASLIARASCFVASESGPTVLAHTTLTPIVALITTGTLAACGDYDRNGVRNFRYHPVIADVPCHGCMAVRPEPFIFFECQYGHNNCVRAFDAAAIADLVEKVRVPA